MVIIHHNSKEVAQILSFRAPNKNVNFVTGANGSGKSSILNALVLGLFAESKHTRRFSRVQDFVQKGKSRAVVQV